RNAGCVQAVVDEQRVGAIGTGPVAGVANVDVEPSVAVDVGQRDTGRPRPLLAESCLGGDVAEPKLAFVEVELRPALVGREDDLWQPIACEVADRYAAAVIEIAVGEDVEVARLGQLIAERDAGLGGGEAREERGARRARRSAAGAGTRGEDGNGRQEPA